MYFSVDERGIHIYHQTDRYLSLYCRKSQDSQKEMKLLLDMYKSVTKESRDKVQVAFSIFHRDYCFSTCDEFVNSHLYAYSARKPDRSL